MEGGLTITSQFSGANFIPLIPNKSIDKYRTLHRISHEQSKDEGLPGGRMKGGL